MNQEALTAWIATLAPGDAVGIFNGRNQVFEASVVRRTSSGMIVCKPGGAFKASGEPHGQLADQSHRLRPAQGNAGSADGNGKNPDGFGFVDVRGEAWKGHINLFWKDFPLALVPPPIATEIRTALILAQKDVDRTGAHALAPHLDKLPIPKPAQASSHATARRQRTLVADITQLVANKNTRDELTIATQADGRDMIDNVSGRTGKAWLEFPRTYATIAACKASATRVFGEPQVWETPE